MPRPQRTLAAALALVSLLAAACHSSMNAAATYTGKHPRSDAVLSAAARDLDCSLNSVGVVVQTNRRVLNEAALRFVIEGCGKRASYVEECDLVDDVRAAVAGGWSVVEDTLVCRYFLVAVVAPKTADRRPEAEDAGVAEASSRP